MSTQGRVTLSKNDERWIVLLASTGVFLVALELTIVSVALPNIVDSLGVRSNPAVTWVFSAYNLVVASLLLVFGWLADRIGRRRVFIAGLLLFAFGSAVSGSANGLNVLIFGRILQGFGGSMMMPASLALILASVSDGRRERAIATWGAMAGLAAAFGPVIGGALVATAGWRAVFLLNVPIAALAIFFTYKHIAESLSSESSTEFSAEQARPSFFSALADISRVPSTLMRLPSFRWAGLSTVPFVAGFTAWVVMAPSFLHEVWGYSAVLTGFAMLPAPLTMALVARPATSLLARLGHRGLIILGALLSTTGLLWWWLLVDERASYLICFLPGALLFGAGIGMGFPMLAAAAVRDVPAARYAAGAAGVTTLRQAAMALGAALAIGIVGKQSSAAAPELLLHHEQLWLICAGLIALAAVLIVGIPNQPNRPKNSSVLKNREGSDGQI